MATEDSIKSINEFMAKFCGQHFDYTRIHKEQVSRGTMRMFNFKKHPDKDIVITTLDDKFVSLTYLTDELANQLGIKKPTKKCQKSVN